MQLLSLIWGIIAIVGMAIAFLPFMAGTNYFVVPFAIIGMVLSIVATRRSKGERERATGITAIVLCSIAIVYGLARFLVGFGAV